MDENEIPHDTCHLGVPSGASKTIFEPMVCSAQTLHLSCVKISTISKHTESGSTWTSSPSSTIECAQNNSLAYRTFGANRVPILHRHLQCLQTYQNEIPHDPCNLGVPSGASKMISKTMVRTVQNVHLSYVKSNTISKWTKTRFHMTHVT
jgi:hypothetical protein